MKYHGVHNHQPQTSDPFDLDCTSSNAINRTFVAEHWFSCSQSFDGSRCTGYIPSVYSSRMELLNPNQGEEFSINARLNQNFSLSYKRSFSLEAAYKNKVGVEYKLNPNFSVIGNVDESGQVQMKFRVRRVY